MLKHEKCAICCHPGYLDADLLDMTSLSIERVRDAQAYMSDVINQWDEVPDRKTLYIK